MALNRSSLKRDLRWGTTGGLSIAVVYCVWVLIIYMLRGSDPFEQAGVSLPMVLITYLGVGLVSGMVVGLLRPLTRWTVGAYAVGLAAGVPFGLGLVVCIQGSPDRWDWATWMGLPILILISGLVIGYELRKHSPPRDP